MGYILTDTGKRFLERVEELFMEGPTSEHEKRILLRALYHIEDAGELPSEGGYVGLREGLLRRDLIEEV